MISSQNNVQKYRTKGHEQVFKEEGFVSIGLGPAELIISHISSKL